MVGSDEAYRDGRIAMGISYSPSAIILFRIDIPQPLRNVIIENFGIVLLHYAFQSGRRFIVYAVGRGVSLDFPVCHTESEVRVRVERLFRFELHLASHVCPVKKRDFTVCLLADRSDVL